MSKKKNKKREPYLERTCYLLIFRSSQTRRCSLSSLTKNLTRDGLRPYLVEYELFFFIAYRGHSRQRSIKEEEEKKTVQVKYEYQSERRENVIKKHKKYRCLFFFFYLSWNSIASWQERSWLYTTPVHNNTIYIQLCFFLMLTFDQVIYKEPSNDVLD